MAMTHSIQIVTVLLLAPLAALHAAAQETPVTGQTAFDIRTFGATGDGKSLNTAAIQKAIDACHAAGGGRVVVPEGVFLTGSVRLKSRVILRIETGATLRGSPDIRDYDLATAPLNWGGWWKFINYQLAPCLIYAEDAEHIGLEGKGTIDGQGGRLRNVFPNAGDSRRPMLVRFQHCRDVTVRDLTLLDPASFTTFFVRTQNIDIEGLTIRSRHTGNGDGLDFDGCGNVRITRCDFDCGDDAISPKSFHPDWPNEHFTITDCRMKTEWAAIRLGPESIAPMRHFEMRDCVFTDCRDGIKIESCENTCFEDLTFSGIEMRDVNRPLYITATRFAFSAHSRSSRPPVGRIRGLRFNGIRATARLGDPAKPFDRTCAAVVSLPDYAIEDITLANVQFTFPGGGTAEQAQRLDVAEMLFCNDYMEWARPFDGPLPGSVLYLRHLRGVRLENVRLTVEKADSRPFIAGDDVDGLTLQDVVASAPESAPGLAKLADARRVTTRNCRVETAASLPVLIEPTTEEQRRLAELRRRSAALDRALQQVADAADAAEKAAQLLVLPAVWDFRPDPRNEGEAACWFVAKPDANWTKLRVDQPWTRQGHADLRGAGWYAATFATPPLAGGHRIFVRFGSVNGTCHVWLDGQRVGERTIDPAYVKNFPWALDLTGVLRPTASHRIVVQVAGTTADVGLTQPVELRLSKQPGKR
jgi:hypothetical protein